MNEWRPIETAPKESVVIVWHHQHGVLTASCRDYGTGYHWVACAQHFEDGEEFLNGVEQEWLEEKQRGITHWMPLPDPPGGSYWEST